MQKVWNFLREPLNLALIIAIASGVGWLWHEFRPSPPSGNTVAVRPTVKTGDVNQTAIANGEDSHAINAGTNATVTISGGQSR